MRSCAPRTRHETVFARTDRRTYSFVGAYLLEEKSDQPTVFSASIGNLPPGKAVLLTITYVTELDFDAGKLMCVVCVCWCMVCVGVWCVFVCMCMCIVCVWCVVV